jgi:hypothetical protein
MDHPSLVIIPLMLPLVLLVARMAMLLFLVLLIAGVLAFLFHVP